jgi:hypothetical protein
MDVSFVKQMLNSLNNYISVVSSVDLVKSSIIFYIINLVSIFWKYSQDSHSISIQSFYHESICQLINIPNKIQNYYQA